MSSESERHGTHAARMTDASPLVARLGRSDRLLGALELACELHGDQFRKGDEGIPYMAHLLGVCALVIEDGGDEDQAIAALLHDAVEDRGGTRTLNRIRRGFGHRVAGIVDACSDAHGRPKPPSDQRKRAYVEKLRTAPPDALRVSLADKLHNARSILADYRRVGDRVWQRFNTYPDMQLWYYGELSAIFSERCPGPMADDLARTVEQLERETGLGSPSGSAS